MDEARQRQLRRAQSPPPIVSARLEHGTEQPGARERDRGREAVRAGADHDRVHAPDARYFPGHGGRGHVGHPLDGAHQPAPDPGRAALSREVDVVAVGSRELARAARTRDEWEIPRGLRLVRGAARGPGVEAVYISLPNTLHVEWSIRALEAGKHVLCEKPMSSASAEVEAAFDAAERSDRLLMEAFMYRHNPQTARLRAARRGGRDRRAPAHALDVLATRCTTPGTSACAPRSRAAR